MIFGPTCNVISDVQMSYCNMFRKFKSGAIKCRFRIENRSGSLADSRGVAETPPPTHSIDGKGPGNSFGVQVKG